MPNVGQYITDLHSQGLDEKILSSIKNPTAQASAVAGSRIVPLLVKALPLLAGHGSAGLSVIGSMELARRAGVPWNPRMAYLAQPSEMARSMLSEIVQKKARESMLPAVEYKSGRRDVGPLGERVDVPKLEGRIPVNRLEVLKGLRPTEGVRDERLITKPPRVDKEQKLISPRTELPVDTGVMERRSADNSVGGLESEARKYKRAEEFVKAYGSKYGGMIGSTKYQGLDDWALVDEVSRGNKPVVVIGTDVLGANAGDKWRTVLRKKGLDYIMGEDRFGDDTVFPSHDPLINMMLITVLS